MNRQERGDRAREISKKFWDMLPEGKERSPENERILLQARIAGRIAARASDGIEACSQSVTRFLPGELGKQFVFREVTSWSDGYKFQENKENRFMARLAKQFERAETSLKLHRL